MYLFCFDLRSLFYLPLTFFTDTSSKKIRTKLRLLGYKMELFFLKDFSNSSISFLEKLISQKYSLLKAICSINCNISKLKTYNIFHLAYISYCASNFKYIKKNFPMLFLANGNGTIKN